MKFKSKYKTLLILFVSWNSFGCGVSPSANSKSAINPIDNFEGGEPDSGLGDRSDAKINLNCDIAAVKKVFETKCMGCHGNGNVLADYDLSASKDWAADHPDLLLGVVVTENGLMPPPQLPQLSDDEKKVFQQCLSPEKAKKAGQFIGKTSVSIACGENKPAVPFPSHTRLLSPNELGNTLSSILGENHRTAIEDTTKLIPSQPKLDRFSSQTKSTTRSHIDGHEQLAEKVGQLLADHSDARKKLHNCLEDLNAVDQNCRDQAVPQMAFKFYRRPATPTEITNIKAIWDSASEAKDAIKFSAMLLTMQPQFLYLIPTSAATDSKGLETLSQYGIAQKLSYWFWKRPPDQELLNLAAAGQLNGSTLAAQAERLIKHNNAKESLHDFVFEWLELGNTSAVTTDANVLQGLNSNTLKSELTAELQNFATEIIQSGGSFQDLLNSTSSDATADLSMLYNSATGKVQLPPKERAGVLTRGGIHIRGTDSGPYHMASMVYRRVVNCTELAPPADVNLLEAVAADNTPKSYRRHFESKTTQPQCIGCHMQLDAYAFALHYDSLGRYLEKEDIRDHNDQFLRKESIDRRVNLFISGKVREGIQVDGPVALSRQISKSEKAERCFLTQFYRYADGREERVADGCSIDKARKSGGGSIMSQLIKMATSQQFLKFKVGP